MLVSVSITVQAQPSAFWCRQSNLFTHSWRSSKPPPPTLPHHPTDRLTDGQMKRQLASSPIWEVAAAWSGTSRLPPPTSGQCRTPAPAQSQLSIKCCLSGFSQTEDYSQQFHLQQGPWVEEKEEEDWKKDWEGAMVKGGGGCIRELWRHQKIPKNDCHGRYSQDAIGFQIIKFQRLSLMMVDSEFLSGLCPRGPCMAPDAPSGKKRQPPVWPLIPDPWQMATTWHRCHLVKGMPDAHQEQALAAVLGTAPKFNPHPSKKTKKLPSVCIQVQDTTDTIPSTGTFFPAFIKLSPAFM